MPDLHHDLLALRFGAPEEWSLVDPEKAVLAGSSSWRATWEGRKPWKEP
jgi:hypothetical protein